MRRFYTLLLRLYPKSFRIEYGDELTTAFAARAAGNAVFTNTVDAIRDVVPNAIAAHWDILSADLRHAVRALRRAPGFAVTAALVVALGVGANTAAFSVADFVLIRPLPFPRPDRLLMLWETTPGYTSMELSPGNYKDWKAQSRSFVSMGAYTRSAVNLTGVGDPQRLITGLVTWDLFNTLGVKPAAGRSFSPADTVAADAVILSYDLWQTQFGGDASVLSRRVDLSGKPFRVIGVMPADFHFPSRDVQLWTPFSFSADQLADRSDNYIIGVGRLRAGVSPERASAELVTIAARLERDYPKQNQGTSAYVERMSDQLSPHLKTLLFALCGAALCILLLACANLANLLLARSAARERELAVRTALGAGRERLVRQILTECFVVALMGGIAGVVVAVAAVPALSALVPTALPIAGHPTIDARVAAFAAALVLATGLAFSLVPAWQAGSASALSALREDARSGGGRRQLRSALVVIEVAASVVLLIASGLLVRAIWRLQDVDTGFRADNVVALTTALPWPRYDDPAARWRFYTAVTSGVRALPRVSSAAYIGGLPMVWRGGIWGVSLTADEQQVRDRSKVASMRFVTPGFFATLGIPIKQGRDVDLSDDANHPYVAVVSESFAQRLWPNEPALGKHFYTALHDRVVVGIAGDIRVRGLETSSEPQMYFSAQQVDKGNFIGYTPQDLVVRCTCAPATLAAEVRRIVHDVDPLQPVSSVRAMRDIVAGETAGRVAQLRVLIVLAVIALLLSGIGIHGLLSFTVARRTREIGVRVALGAQSGEVLRMILRQGLTLALLAILPGALVAYWAGRAMESVLVGVKPGDPATFAAAIIMCAATTIIGCIRPAIRAARVDPIEALRSD